MSKNKDIHVIPHPGGGWQGKREGAERASVTGDTKKEVQERSREIAQRDKVELVIHGRDGRIQDSDSFGPDPNPPKDNKH
jgi:hypothetical protein